MATKTAKDQPRTEQPRQVTMQEDGSFAGPDITRSVGVTLSNGLPMYAMQNVLAAPAGFQHMINYGAFMQPPPQAQSLALDGGAEYGATRQNQPFVLDAMKIAGAQGRSGGIINRPLAIGGDSTSTPKDAAEMAKYKDYSRMPFELVHRDVASINGASGKDPSFPMKLHQIISAQDHEEFITCWLPHGRSWRVVKPKAFEAKVIPLYFRHAKHASFMRQVNGWGFKRITQGPDQNSYYHEVS
jgi:hypothetical protein